MKVPPLSERPDIEEDEQDFLTPPSRRKKRSRAATRAALRAHGQSVSASPYW